MTTMTNPLANVPLPAGASFVDQWADLNTPNPSRYFEAPRQLIALHHGDTPCAHGDVVVFAAGMQHADGPVIGEVCVTNCTLITRSLPQRRGR